MKKNRPSSLVYSTSASICVNCGMEKAECDCREKKDVKTGDGILRVRREVKGRKGKTVTVISGLEHDDSEMKELAKTLKQKTGSGGSVKDGLILIQGDHREKIKTELEKNGYRVKLSG